MVADMRRWRQLVGPRRRTASPPSAQHVDSRLGGCGAAVPVPTLPSCAPVRPCSRVRQRRARARVRGHRATGRERRAMRAAASATWKPTGAAGRRRAGRRERGLLLVREALAGGRSWPRPCSDGDRPRLRPRIEA